MTFETYFHQANIIKEGKTLMTLIDESGLFLEEDIQDQTQPEQNVNAGAEENAPPTRLSGKSMDQLSTNFGEYIKHAKQAIASLKGEKGHFDKQKKVYFSFRRKIVNYLLKTVKYLEHYQQKVLWQYYHVKPQEYQKFLKSREFKRQNLILKKIKSFIETIDNEVVN